MQILGPLKVDENCGGSAPPTKELLESMGRFIEEVTNAGVLLATDGFQPSLEGRSQVFDF